MLHPKESPLKMEISKNNLSQNYEDMTVVELRALAADKDINITSNMKKSEIIEIIMESEV
ncbi:hypothetical protein HCG75_04385 [Clostridium sp. K12(2020)]|uniref:Rho termination factor N-terminal domain-containing protein n=1 Tax=unclassified Clostridium TaxID=2614128 RepID=UPI001C8CC8D9|nr:MULTISPECIES: Rho termination factor N-terminal domain-containing protein [unclassified Clostridium]MBX9136669.1 hypothetical protein [Clostridium sp. K12(2020)]MBX9145282.1 hypothetical protein [Clostridium sp. K13]